MPSEETQSLIKTQKLRFALVQIVRKSFGVTKFGDTLLNSTSNGAFTA